MHAQFFLMICTPVQLIIIKTNIDVSLSIFLCFSLDFKSCFWFIHQPLWYMIQEVIVSLRLFKALYDTCNFTIASFKLISHLYFFFQYFLSNTHKYTLFSFKIKSLVGVRGRVMKNSNITLGYLWSFVSVIDKEMVWGVNLMF